MSRRSRAAALAALACWLLLVVFACNDSRRLGAVFVTTPDFPTQITGLDAGIASARPIAKKRVVFTAASTVWVAPSDVSVVHLIGWGGGGGGGYGGSGFGFTGSIPGAGGGGGGGGAAGWGSEATIAVTPGTSYTILVGAGGTGGNRTGPIAPLNGGDSKFTVTSGGAVLYSWFGGRAGAVGNDAPSGGSVAGASAAQSGSAYGNSAYTTATLNGGLKGGQSGSNGAAGPQQAATEMLGAWAGTVIPVLPALADSGALSTGGGGGGAYGGNGGYNQFYALSATMPSGTLGGNAAKDAAAQPGNTGTTWSNTNTGNGGSGGSGGGGAANGGTAGTGGTGGTGDSGEVMQDFITKT